LEIKTFSREKFLHQLESFHGSLAPGLIIGGFMVNIAAKSLPREGLFDAICETPLYPPDAIQLLTPGTIGNGWLRVLNFGRFAITLYEKYSGVGVRLYLDSIKLKKHPEIHSWYFKLKPKNEQDSQLLINQIIEAEDNILSLQRIRLQPELLRRGKIRPVTDFPQCGEGYPLRDGLLCRACTPFFSH
jgi:formylmethanofuran dehydrogenase subunit E